MTPADRRFTSWLFIVFGPLFVVGGFGFAFTDPGAILVYFGAGMLCSGLLLKTRIPVVAACAAGVAVFAALTVWLIVERSG